MILYFMCFACTHVQQAHDKDVPSYIRPPMRDAAAWTSEPEYERFLHVRVFKPENMEQRELRCSLTVGKQNHKTDVLDPPAPPEEDEAPVPAKSTSPADGRPARPMRGRGRGRGAARGRAGRPGAARGGHSTEALVGDKKAEGPK